MAPGMTRFHTQQIIGVNEDPPPSTLAARIVHNIEVARHQPDAGNDRAHLQELLLLILESENQSTASQPAFNDNLEENRKLIIVIVKACLEPISAGNPFDSQDQLRTQGSQSLAVIDLTIRRLPDVLFVPFGNHGNSPGPEGPLFLWLIPQLVNLLGHIDFPDIPAGASKALGTALSLQTKSSALNFRSQPILRYLEGCVAELLLCTEAMVNADQNKIKLVTDYIPSAAAVSKACSSDIQIARDTSPIWHDDISRNGLLVVHILSAIINSKPKTVPDLVLSNSAIDYGWIVDRLFMLWPTMITPRVQPMQSFAKSLAQGFFETLGDCVSSLSFLKYETVACSRAAVLHSQALAHFLSSFRDIRIYDAERTLCFSIIRVMSISLQSAALSQVYHEHLDPCIQEVVLNEKELGLLKQDLQRALVLASQLATDPQFTTPPELLDFDDLQLRDEAERLVWNFKESSSDHQDMENRPNKRPRIPNSSSESGFRDLHGSNGNMDRLVRLDESAMRTVAANFKDENEDGQCSLFNSIGQTACSGSGAYSVAGTCSYCDVDSQHRLDRAFMDEDLCKELYNAMTDLLCIAQEQKRPRTRVSAMLALKRLLSHSSVADHFAIRTTPLGQWCCVSLKSSLRDLRMAAVSTMTIFIEDTLKSEYLRQNRLTALDQFRGLAEKNDLTLQETCILGLGQIASNTSSEDEINIILLRLVEYLGHSNPLINGLAYEELLKLSSHNFASARQLFEPYWRTVAVAIVKNLQKRPQIAQSVCDILGWHVSEFLRRTQFDTIPYLVWTIQSDILQRIAAASGHDMTVHKLCYRRGQLAAILSFLLLQPSADTEDMVIGLMSKISSEFAETSLVDLLRSDTMNVAYELLKMAGDQDPSASGRVYQVINYVAKVTQQPQSSRNSSGRKQDAMGSFFQTWALAIVQLLSDKIGQVKGSQSFSERKRCIGAIREMAILAKSRLCHALPQICSCLRATIEDGALCNEAFSAWMTLLKTLDEEDIGDIVDPTFAILVQHWDKFDSSTQQQAHDMIGVLFTTHGEMIHGLVETMPSLGSIPLLSKFEAELSKLKAQMDPKRKLRAFCQRCQSEDATVVSRALTELETYLEAEQSYIHASTTSEQPELVIGELVRSLLDACVRFKDTSHEMAISCARCLGLIGCIDPTRVEAVKEYRQIFVLSNFRLSEETVDFVLFFLQEVLVKVYLATTVTNLQQLLAFGMQELLRLCDFDASVTFRREMDDRYKKWIALPELTRNILTPFLTSRYTVNSPASLPEKTYPLYRNGMEFNRWLRDFVLDLLEKSRGENASLVFSICRRLVRSQDIAIANFLLPYVLLNVVVEGSHDHRINIAKEMLAILSQPLSELDQVSRDHLLLCSQTVFRTIDYLSRWVQEKRGSLVTKHRTAQTEQAEAEFQIRSVENVIELMPADIMSRRAVECKSFARALFYWEQYIREQKELEDKAEHFEPLYERLQEIYTQIDEPDGIEGISSCFQELSMEQQILEDRKAGRWTAVQSWYELRLAKAPDDVEAQLNLLTSLRESGQHDVLLSQISALNCTKQNASVWGPFAVEASWVTGRWGKLAEHLQRLQDVLSDEGDFNLGVGAALAALHKGAYGVFKNTILELMLNSTRPLSSATTSSLQACHDTMLKFHVLVELEMISGVDSERNLEKSVLNTVLGQRLDVLGAFSSDKQYLLGIRRAAMQLSRQDFSSLDISSAWLISAKLARKANFAHQAFNAVLHASELNDTSATIEHSRLMWKEGHHRKAIQSLEGAIAANAFRSEDFMSLDGDSLQQQDQQQRQNVVAARAQLLLAKWIDRAGQTQSDTIIKSYRNATAMHSRWEKGFYHIGKHYNKLLESERANPPAKQVQTFITGEMAKLVIENYIRSLAWGTKYIYQTLPKLLTLWLDLGTEVDSPIDPKYGNGETFQEHTQQQRKKIFGAVMAHMRKYIDRLPAFVFYTAYAQIVARICHPNKTVNASLVDIVAKIVTNHPQQALWPLFAMMKSSTADRAKKGLACKAKVLESAKKTGSSTAKAEIETLLIQGQKLTEQLVNVCNNNKAIDRNPKKPLSLAIDMGFNHKKSAPCRLVIPLEATLLATLPPAMEHTRMYKPFAKDAVTISAFLDEVIVLSSLARPRKVSIRGSDGKKYDMLCKPKDDLRKDQRLLEFNSMISRILKRDSECSKRRLYIKTYAVTPLNEECGLIEWVEGMKTLREILLGKYRQKAVQIHYDRLKQQMATVTADHKQVRIFTEDVLGQFPPVLHEWFVDTFPEPSAWFAARLRYTRSCAVMSMVGHVLGLGDRHGENILLEEGRGGTFHVDFNCLFDKGKTFETPERVPFRLTHNMVDAFGAYGVNGPFRRSCELTLGILRQHEDTLMTILETFLYDPTADFIGKKKQRHVSDVPETPEGVLESVRAKVRGLLPMESVPLSVEGYVQLLIDQATDPVNMASMYIGWCPFL